MQSSRVGGETHERRALEHAVGVGGQVREERPLEEEVAAVDPVVLELGLLVEGHDVVALELELAEAGGRVDAEDGADVAMRLVVRQLGRKVRVGDAVAVGHREHGVVVAEVTGGGLGHAGAGHRVLAGIGERDVPVLVVVDRVRLDGVGLQADGAVAGHRRVVQEVRLDDVRLVAQTQHEAPEAVVGVPAHDVPEDRTGAELDHRLRADLALRAHAGAASAAENEHRDVARIGHRGEVRITGRPRTTLCLDRQQSMRGCGRIAGRECGLRGRCGGTAVTTRRVGRGRSI